MYFLEKAFWLSPRLVLFFTLSLFAVIFLRYVILSGAYHLWKRSKLKTDTTIPNRQFLRELIWSMVSSAIFTVLTVSMLLVYQEGHTRIYTDVNSFGWVYFFASLFAYLVLYETYYYWLHRWMHMPGIFRIVHKIHHESIHTSAFTSFSFHPLEALLQFIFLPLLVLIIPINIYALGIFLLLMTVSAIINHAGIEIFPGSSKKHRLANWIIGSTHHELHHKEFKSNYGLYFTFWDKWMQTESKKFESRFRENTVSRSQSPHHRSADDRHM